MILCSEKKRVLFISSNMHIGGFQKSLIAVLRCFDYDRYDVDLLLLHPTGLFLDLIPKQVNLLPPMIPPEYFDRAPAAVWQLLRQKHWGLAMRRLCSAAAFLVDKGWGAYILSRGIPGLHQKYDAAIDYNGQQILYYLVDAIDAKRKITYFHSDYKKWPYYKNMDMKYYKHADAIVTVSDQCVRSMQEVFPDCGHKIHCIENIISPKTVSLFPEGQNGFSDGYDGKRIVTVGRVCRDKGIVLALKSCALLKQWGIRCRWYWIGPWDTQKERYLAARESLGIREDFVFLGATNNPYDYIRQADLVAHPSYFEGKSVALEEAKVLGTPIVATNFSTVYDQIEDGKTGQIVEMEPEKIAGAIRHLLEDPELYGFIQKNLQACGSGNESEIEKLYRLIEGA